MVLPDKYREYRGNVIFVRGIKKALYNARTWVAMRRPIEIIRIRVSPNPFSAKYRRGTFSLHYGAYFEFILRNEGILAHVENLLQNLPIYDTYNERELINQSFSLKLRSMNPRCGYLDNIIHFVPNEISFELGYIIRITRVRLIRGDILHEPANDDYYIIRRIILLRMHN